MSQFERNEENRKRDILDEDSCKIIVLFKILTSFSIQVVPQIVNYTITIAIA
jgi:hypothetical protein